MQRVEWWLPGTGWRGASVLLLHTAPYFDSARTELHPLSRSLICSFVLPCAVGREGTIVSVLPKTRGHIVEHDEKEVFALSIKTCATQIQMGVREAGERGTSEKLSPSSHAANSRNMHLF